MMKSTLIGIGLALCALPAAAQDLDCGTAGLVKSATVPLEACVDLNVWQPAEPAGDQEFVYFSRNGRAGFAIVTEKATLDSGAYRAAILRSAGAQSGSSDSAASYGDGSGDINGAAWNWMHYDVTVTGTAFAFLNYYYSEPGLGSAQLIFWSLPGDAAMVEGDLAGKVMPTVTLMRPNG